MSANAQRVEARASDMVTVRMPIEMRSKLERAAEASERSLAQEIRHRLRVALEQGDGK